MNDTLIQMDLIDKYRTFDPKQAKYALCTSAHGTFQKINHMVGFKTCLNKFKNTEIISSIYSDHNELKLETNLKEKTQSFKYMETE